MEATSSSSDRSVVGYRAIFERGAEGASRALSTWIDRPVRLTVGNAALVDLVEATTLLGDPERSVAACSMALAGRRLSGQVILVFEDRSGFALVDRLLRQPEGTATSWGDLERSAVEETTNIIGCAFLNALADHLPGETAAASEEEEGGSAGLIPSPPHFFQEFAGSLLEFALSDQLAEFDRVLVVQSQFEIGTAEGTAEPSEAGIAPDWTLLFVPTGATVRALAGVSEQSTSNPR